MSNPVVFALNDGGARLIGGANMTDDYYSGEWVCNNLATLETVRGIAPLNLVFSPDSPMEITIPAGETDWHFKVNCDGTRINVPLSLAGYLGFHEIEDMANDIAFRGGLGAIEAARRAANVEAQSADTASQEKQRQSDNTFLRALGETIAEYWEKAKKSLGFNPLLALLAVVCVAVFVRFAF